MKNDNSENQPVFQPEKPSNSPLLPGDDGQLNYPPDKTDFKTVKE